MLQPFSCKLGMRLYFAPNSKSSSCLSHRGERRSMQAENLWHFLPLGWGFSGSHNVSQSFIVNSPPYLQYCHTYMHRIICVFCFPFRSSKVCEPPAWLWPARLDVLAYGNTNRNCSSSHHVMMSEIHAFHDSLISLCTGCRYVWRTLCKHHPHVLLPWSFASIKWYSWPQGFPHFTQHAFLCTVMDQHACTRKYVPPAFLCCKVF